jgi:hypothetical protein
MIIHRRPAGDAERSRWNVSGSGKGASSKANRQEDSTCIEGTLIAESIRVGEELGGVRLVTRKISRAAVGDVSAGQQELWTLIEFEADERDAGVLAEALAKVLDRPLGRYTDFRTPDETFVVFAGRVFRYPRGDGQGPAPSAGRVRRAGRGSRACFPCSAPSGEADVPRTASPGEAEQGK